MADTKKTKKNAEKAAPKAEAPAAEKKAPARKAKAAAPAAGPHASLRFLRIAPRKVRLVANEGARVPRREEDEPRVRGARDRVAAPWELRRERSWDRKSIRSGFGSGSSAPGTRSGTKRRITRSGSTRTSTSASS